MLPEQSITKTKNLPRARRPKNDVCSQAGSVDRSSGPYRLMEAGFSWSAAALERTLGPSAGARGAERANPRRAQVAPIDHRTGEPAMTRPGTSCDETVCGPPL